MTTKILALLALLSVGVVSAVYAETSTVEVPFDSHGQSCWYDELAVEFHCTWQGVVEKFTMEDLKEFRDLLDETVYNEELERLQEEALAEIEAEKSILSPTELKIQTLEDRLDRGVGTVQDSVLYHLLKELDTCTQGMDKQTAPFQTAREITKSSFDKWTYNHIEYKGEIGYIVKAIEECKAQNTLLKVVGAGYENMPTGADDHQFSLMDIYTPDVQAVPFDKLKSTTTEIDKSAICDNRQFADTQKAQFGCEILYDGLTADQIKRQNEVMFGTDGVINYHSEALDKYMTFMQEYGNKYATTEDKHNQALIAEPIRDEMFEDNLFYERHNED